MNDLHLLKLGDVMDHSVWRREMTRGNWSNSSSDSDAVN